MTRMMTLLVLCFSSGCGGPAAAGDAASQLDLSLPGGPHPDLSLAGGFTQCKKIAALAEAAFMGYFPHLMGSPVNVSAYLQLDAATKPVSTQA